MAEIGKVELSTEDYLKISNAMLEIARQRDEAQNYARIMHKLLAEMPVDLADLDSRLADLPDWVYQGE